MKRFLVTESDGRDLWYGDIMPHQDNELLFCSMEEVLKWEKKNPSVEHMVFLVEFSCPDSPFFEVLEILSGKCAVTVWKKER